jgi:hypothetical protein
MATKKFSDPWLRGLKAAAEGVRDEWYDEAETGLLVTVNPKRRVTFWLYARYPKSDGTFGAPSRRVLGDYSPVDAKRVFKVKKGVLPLTLDEARQKARVWKAMIAAGVDPGMRAAEIEEVEPEAGPETIATVFAEYLKRHVKKRDRRIAEASHWRPCVRLRKSNGFSITISLLISPATSGGATVRSHPLCAAM